jgi:hypothetical protein
MNYDEIVEMLEETELPLAYDHFEEGFSPAPPFLCFLLPESDNFAADGIAYQKIHVLHIELYTDKKNPEQEENIERVLTTHGLFYDKTEVYIESEKLYEVLYELEV